MRKTKEQHTKDKKLKTSHGITLIALIITIIVMIILVAVTVTMAVNGGLFSKAQKAGIKTNEAVKKEQELGNGKINIAGQEYNSPQEYVDTITGGNSGGEKVYLGMDNEETDSGIGYYVCVDGQYGVIYADLAYSRTNCQWYNSNGAYSYTAKEHDELKKYYLNGTYDPGDEYGTAWGEKPLLVADEELNKTEGRTIDRFYVMALTNYSVNGYTTFHWNENYSTNEETFGTSTEFETGAYNTELLIKYWDNNESTGWTAQDIWNNLPSSSNWFVPSRAEWAAFAQEIVNDTYSNYGLSLLYWSSSQYGVDYAWCPDFIVGSMEDFDIDVRYRVRLSTTF